MILQISARDGDEGINDTIVYSIASTGTTHIMVTYVQ